jgi:hypothetical protein
MSYVIPIAYPDPPYIIDTSVTPIPGNASLPLQIIADTGLNTGVGVSFNDQTGNFIGVYVGNIGQEVLIAIIGNGTSGLGWGTIPANSRISIKSMTSNPITLGLLNIIVVSI